VQLKKTIYLVITYTIFIQKLTQFIIFLIFCFICLGGLAILWSIFFLYFATETPETNSRISAEEKHFLQSSIGYSQVSHGLSMKETVVK